jgi:hypothetical protein
MGVLDDNGSIELRNLIPGGKHVLTISKANHESRVFEIAPSSPSSEIRVPNAALIPWATLTLQPTVDNATVKFRRVGESQFHNAPSGKIPLPPGARQSIFQPGAERPSMGRFSTSTGSKRICAWGNRGSKNGTPCSAKLNFASVFPA